MAYQEVSGNLSEYLKADQNFQFNERFRTLYILNNR